jgi:hypothetical protein
VNSFSFSSNVPSMRVEFLEVAAATVFTNLGNNLQYCSCRYSSCARNSDAGSGTTRTFACMYDVLVVIVTKFHLMLLHWNHRFHGQSYFMRIVMFQKDPVLSVTSREKLLLNGQKIYVVGFIQDKEKRPVMHFVRAKSVPEFDAIQLASALDNLFDYNPKKYHNDDTVWNSLVDAYWTTKKPFKGWLADPRVSRRSFL